MRIRLGLFCAMIFICFLPKATAEIVTYGDVHYVYSEETAGEKTFSISLNGERIDPDTLQIVDDPEQISAVFGVYAKAGDGSFVPFPDPQNPLRPLQITVGNAPVSIALPLSVDLFIRQETIPTGYNASLDGETYRPIFLPEDIALVCRRSGLQGLRVTVRQGGEQTEPAASVQFEMIGADDTHSYSARTDADGFATLFPIPAGNYILKQTKAQAGFSISEPEIHITVPKDDILQIKLFNPQNGFLAVNPVGETLNEALLSEKIPLKREYEVFDQNGKSYGVVSGGETIELPASVLGLLYIVQAADTEPADGFPADGEVHKVLLASGKQTAFEPVIQINQGLFQFSHVSEADGMPVPGGTFALYCEEKPDALLIFQADENGRYSQRTPIDAGNYTLKMTYAADGFQYMKDVCPVEIKPYFQDNSSTDVRWKSKPATKEYLDRPAVVSDIQVFPSLFETDAEFDFQLRTAERGSLAMEITDVSIQMEEPDIRGVQIIEMRQDGAELLVQRRLGIPETEEFVELNVSGTVRYTAHYPVSSDQTLPIDLEDHFTVPVAAFLPIEERPRYALYGRILEENGDPVEGLRVSRQDPTGKLLYEQTITDAFGAYAFFATSGDAYVVYHPEPGYGVFENENGGDAILLPLQALHGRVIDHGVLGDSMITLQMGQNEIIPDVDGNFIYSGAYTTEDELSANVMDQAVAVFDENGGEILVHVYRAATIMGAVVDECGGMVVEGALVTLTGKDGVERATTTDSSGAYAFFRLLQGDYVLTFAPPEGYLLADSESVSVSVTAGEKRMVRRISVMRPATIAGTVVTEDDTPMGGIEIVLQPTGSVAKTQPDGTFSFDGLPIDTYRLEIKKRDDYVPLALPEPIELTCAGARAEVQFRITKSASISGTIWNDAGEDEDPGEAGLRNAVVTLLTEQGEEVATARTESDGVFRFAALLPDTYQLSVELPPDMIFSESREGSFIQGVNDTKGISGLISLQPGEALDNLRCGAVVSSTIWGHLWLDTDGSGQFTGLEPAMAGATITLSQPDGARLTVTTDDAGEYQFKNLRAGDYTLTFALPDTCAFSGSMNWGRWGANRPDADAQSTSVAISITLGEAAPVIDVPVLQRASVNARVWADADLDGTDRNEEGVGDIHVRLLSLSGDSRELISEFITDAEGYALFDRLLPGDYALEIQLPNDSWGFVSGVDSLLSNGWASGPKLSVSADRNPGLIGAGIARLGHVRGVAFTDANYDGLCGDDEIGLAAKVTLYNEAEEVIAATAASRTDGTYSFEDILPGTYSVDFSLDKGYRFTRNRPDAPSFSSNVPEQPGPAGRTAPFFLPMGETVLVDAGAYPASSVSGAVWEDIHNTGQYVQGNPPIAGLNITLVSEDQDVAQTATDQNGKYKFEDLPPGTYLVRVELPDGIRFSTQTFATGHANNIQQTEITLGKTPKFYLPMGTNKTDVDAGAVYPGTLSGFARSPDDFGVQGVRISVIRDGTIHAETFTAEDGSYLFENLRSGPVTLHFELPEGWLFAEGQNREIPIVIPQGKRVGDINIKLYGETVIEGSVWLDENADGVRDDNEKPLVGAVVALQQHTSREDETGVIVSITGTNVDGVYYFSGLNPGLYSLRIVPPEYTYLYSGNALPSKVYELKESETIHHNAPAFMAGYLRGRVFEDRDNDGKFGDGDILLTEIPLELRDEAGEAIRDSVTDSEGNYLFNELKPGRYTVRVFAPDGYVFVEPAEGESVFLSGGISQVIDFAMGDMKNNVDAALLRPSSIGDLVWLDLNGNGLQETNEPGIAGIQVTLYGVSHGNLQPVAETKTDGKGRYRFDEIVPGNYQLVFTIDEYLPTKPFDSLPEINSKIPWVNKPAVSTETFPVYSGENILNIDAGLVTFDLAESLGWTSVEDGRISAP